MNDYFSELEVRCESSLDEETFERIYDALYIENTDTFDEDNMVDALSTLDSNVYNLCSAIIEQNFMLQRRIEKIEGMLERLV